MNNKKHGHGIFCGSTIHYDGYWQNDVYSGYGVLTTDIKNQGLITYKGIFLNGFYHGNGIYITPNYEYVGKFKFDKMYGQGIATFEDGQYSCGTFENQQIVDGILVVPFFSTYLGTLQSQAFHGTGKFELDKFNYTYQRDYYNGQKHGKGKEILSDYYYEGDFKNNLRHVRGKIYWNNGNLQEGEFLKGNKHGFGKYTLSGVTYHGQFIEDEDTGYGTITYSDGRVYTGEHDKGKPHGKGTLIYQEIYELKGIFIEGLLQGYGTMTDKTTGLQYSGDFVDQRLHFGVVEGQNGQYKGQLKGLSQDGYGKLTLQNGDELEGEWIEGQLQGQVIVSNNQDVLYEGHWLNNRPNGIGVLKWTVSGSNYFKELFEGVIPGQTIQVNETLEIITNSEYIQDFSDDEALQYIFDGVWQNGDYIFGKLQARDKLYKGSFINNCIQITDNESVESSEQGAVSMFQESNLSRQKDDLARKNNLQETSVNLSSNYLAIQMDQISNSNIDAE